MHQLPRSISVRKRGNSSLACIITSSSYVLVCKSSSDYNGETGYLTLKCSCIRTSNEARQTSSALSNNKLLAHYIRFNLPGKVTIKKSRVTLLEAFSFIAVAAKRQQNSELQLPKHPALFPRLARYNFA